MSDLPESLPAVSPVAPSPVIHAWDADVIFPIIADPVRRRLLLRLAAGTPQAASQLAPGAQRRLDAVLKHLTALRAAGLVLTNADTQDGRRLLYSLSPAVTLRKTATGLEMDFGCCVLRL